MHNLTDRIDQIPVIHKPQGDRLRGSIDDRDVEIFSTAPDRWHWRTTDYPWHHPMFMDSKPYCFESAAGAQNDAVKRIGASYEQPTEG